MTENEMVLVNLCNEVIRLTNSRKLNWVPVKPEGTESYVVEYHTELLGKIVTLSVSTEGKTRHLSIGGTLILTSVANCLNEMITNPLDSLFELVKHGPSVGDPLARSFGEYLTEIQKMDC